MKAGKLDEAERLYELARKDDPYHTKWIAGLARVHLRKKDKAKFLDDLAMIADNDADDLDVRKALAEQHLAAGHADQAEKWATECLYIDVYDPANHVLLADALAAGKKYAEAIEEYQTALDLQGQEAQRPEGPLARALLALGRRDDARKHPRRPPQGRPRPPRGQAVAPAGRRLIRTPDQRESKPRPCGRTWRASVAGEVSGTDAARTRLGRRTGMPGLPHRRRPPVPRLFPSAASRHRLRHGCNRACAIDYAAFWGFFFPEPP